MSSKICYNHWWKAWKDTTDLWLHKFYSLFTIEIVQYIIHVSNMTTVYILNEN